MTPFFTQERLNELRLESLIADVELNQRLDSIQPKGEIFNPLKRFGSFLMGKVATRSGAAVDSARITASLKRTEVNS